MIGMLEFREDELSEIGEAVEARDLVFRLRCADERDPSDLAQELQCGDV